VLVGCPFRGLSFWIFDYDHPVNVTVNYGEAIIKLQWVSMLCKSYFPSQLRRLPSLGIIFTEHMAARATKGSESRCTKATGG
jgi:hypothetical protein